MDEGNPTGQPEKPWLYRPDAFSSYRSGFEVRTCRRCERVLMLHHIPDQPAGPGRAAQPGYRGVVRSTEFTYDDETRPQPRHPARLQLPEAGGANGVEAGRRLRPHAAACRRWSSNIPNPSCRRSSRGLIRESGEPAHRAGWQRLSAGPTCMAKASPASSPSRPAPGSTSATGARSRRSYRTAARS